MILLLGKSDAIEKYVESIDIDTNEISYYPNPVMHHTEYGKCINVIKATNPPAIVTQNLEMLDVLLESDLEIENVIRVREVDDCITFAEYTKEKAWELREECGLDLR